MKKMIVSLLLLQSLTAVAETEPAALHAANSLAGTTREVCGRIISVSNHAFSEGRVSNIAIESPDSKNFPQIFLYDQRDLLPIIKAMMEIEPAARRANIKKIRLSDDASAKYQYYTNYQFSNYYYACAILEVSSRQIKFPTTVGLMIIAKDGLKKEIIYSRDYD